MIVEHRANFGMLTVNVKAYLNGDQALSEILMLSQFNLLWSRLTICGVMSGPAVLRSESALNGDIAHMKLLGGFALSVESTMSNGIFT